MKPEDFEGLVSELRQHAECAHDDDFCGDWMPDPERAEKALMSAIRSLCDRSEYRRIACERLEAERDALQARLQVAELDAERLLKMNHNLADQLAIDRLSIKDPDIAALAKEQPR